MDSASLLNWIRGNAHQVLGSNGNQWLLVIEVATGNLQRSRQPVDRSTFREATLLALELAEQAGALPVYECVRRNLSVRATYVRQGILDPEWLRREATSMFEFFSRSVPFGFDAAALLVREKRRVGVRSHITPEDNLSLIRISSLLRPINDIEKYFDPQDREAARQWLDLMRPEAT